MPLFMPDEPDLLRCLINDYINTSPQFGDNGHKWYFEQLSGRYDHINGIYPEMLTILIRSLLPTPYGPAAEHLNKLICFDRVLKTHERYPNIFSNVVPSGSSSEKVAVHTNLLTDFDVMYILQEEALKELGVIDKRTEHLHLENDCVSPAYVRLVAVDVHNRSTIIQSRSFKQVFNLFESTALHPTLQILKENDFIFSNTVASSFKGPAMTSVLELHGSDQVHCDYVFALPVYQSEILSIFSKWINRVQEKQVFSDSQLKEVRKSLQCYIIPVGLNKEDNELWRLSFSATETAIFSNMDYLNRDVYRYAKLILGHWTVIPSYFLKTAFFWMMEDVPRKKWVPKKLVDLTRWLFEKLQIFLVKQFLPHFFIPTQNLLATKSSMEIRIYLQQCTWCLHQWQTLPYDTLTIGMPLFQQQQNTMFGDEGEDIGKRWNTIQGCVIQYSAHMMGTSVKRMIKYYLDSTATLCNHLIGRFSGTIICKDSIDALYLCPHIPFSAFVDLFVAAALRGVDCSSQVNAQTTQREKMLLGLNICFERSVSYMITKEYHIHSDAIDQYECLMHQPSISVVGDANLYITHLISSIGLRHTMLCLRELLLLSARKYTSINLECSGIDRLYCGLINCMDCKINDMNCFTLKGGKAYKAGLEAINKLQATVTVFYANFCVREHIFEAENVLRRVISLAEVRPTVDLHLWQLPLFDHSEQLCEHLDLIKHQKALGYRSVELPVGFFCKCMSDELERVLVYDRTQTPNTDLPKHMDLAKVLLSNQYSRTDLWPVIRDQLSN